MIQNDRFDMCSQNVNAFECTMSCFLFQEKQIKTVRCSRYNKRYVLRYWLLVRAILTKTYR